MKSIKTKDISDFFRFFFFSNDHEKTWRYEEFAYYSSEQVQILRMIIFRW